MLLSTDMGTTRALGKMLNFRNRSPCDNLENLHQGSCEAILSSGRYVKFRHPGSVAPHCWLQAGMNKCTS